MTKAGAVVLVKRDGEGGEMPMEGELSLEMEVGREVEVFTLRVGMTLSKDRK